MSESVGERVRERKRERESVTLRESEPERERESEREIERERVRERLSLCPSLGFRLRSFKIWSKNVYVCMMNDNETSFFFFF